MRPILLLYRLRGAEVIENTLK